MSKLISVDTRATRNSSSVHTNEMSTVSDDAARIFRNGEDDEVQVVLVGLFLVQLHQFRNSTMWIGRANQRARETR